VFGEDGGIGAVREAGEAGEAEEAREVDPWGGRILSCQIMRRLGRNFLLCIHWSFCEEGGLSGE
jgi:hypothetical protein